MNKKPASRATTATNNEESKARFDLLKTEITLLDSSIKKFDDLANSVKHWSVTLWGGSFALFLQHPQITQYIAITAAIPLVFLLSDAHWRRLQRSFIYRYSKITHFINSKNFDQALNYGDFAEFPILDPRTWLSKGEYFKEFTSFRKVINFRSVSIFYLIQCHLSLTISIWVTHSSTLFEASTTHPSKTHHPTKQKIYTAAHMPCQMHNQPPSA